MQNSLAPYTPRNPRLSDYYRCVEDFFEELERVHEDRYQARLGYLRPEIRFIIFRYLDCGCLQNGFARVRCDDCGHEYQMVRYYGYYSNAARGKRRKLGLIDTEIPEIAGQEADSAYRKKCRANWARLIQKIYEIDPLTCPNCGGTMRVLAFIEEAAVIRKILDHLGLWDVPKRQPKRGREPPVVAVEDALLVYANSQVIEYQEAYYTPGIPVKPDKMRRCSRDGLCLTN